jgi:hypothetical protein
MKLLMENWRKYLKQEKLLKESVSAHYDTLDEGDLYGLNLEDLLALRDFIKNFSGPGPADPKDLYPTIMARIEALEDEEGHTPPPDREIENLYDGEFILKLLKTYWSSANQGIELASMIPGTESLLAEFKRTREQVASLIEYAEDNDDSPWMDRSVNDPSESLPDEVENSMRLLMHQVIKPVELESGISDDEQEVVDGYHRLIDSLAGLGQYAQLMLHGKNISSPLYNQQQLQKYVNDYDFIKKWGGEG